MKQGRIEVTELTNYKRIKKLIKGSKHIGLVDKAGFRELLTCDIPALTKPKGFVLIDEMSVRDYKKSSKWKYIKRALDRNQSYYNPIQEILIFDTRFEALQWLAKSDSIFVKMQEPVNQPKPNAQKPITTIWQPFNNG